MAERELITIGNPQYGVGQSAFVGFQEIRNLNITDKPGVCFPNKALAKESGSVVNELITILKIDPLSGIVYGVSNTKFYKRTTGGDWSVITGHTSTSADYFLGMEIWRSFNDNGSYIFLFHESGKIDVYDSSGGQSWADNFKNSWITNMTGSFLGIKIRQSLIADDRIYISRGSGNYGLAMIMENDGETFDPDDSGTYTVEKGSSVIDFPKNNNVRCLTSVSGLILNGTNIIFDNTKGTIYPWDYHNEAVSYNKPIETGEDGVHQMATYNNIAFLHAGTNGKIFYTSGSQTTELFAKIPLTLSSAIGEYIDLYPEAFKICGDKILIGIGGSGPVSGANYGIYSINIFTKKISIENTISKEDVSGNPETGDNNDIYIGAILPLDPNNYLVSWYDGNSGTYGVDKTSSNNVTDDKAYLISEFFNLSGGVRKVSLENPIINLTKPLSDGDSVKVWYREAQNGSWTLHHTMTSGQTAKMNVLPNKQNIQLKVALNNNAELYNIQI